MTVVRMRYVRRGKHYHCRFFTSRGHGLTFALCGTLTLDAEDFTDLRAEYPEWDWLDDEEREAA